ncbi:MAG: gamma-glutamylcyclotransferase family protein [Cellvibrio sp.]|uniref:gamma-glutamylcyclotransferase family protein n=1 Tax=Cellvibrio sp. TaxID=1965322 RepID=UPI0031ADBE55
MIKLHYFAYGSNLHPLRLQERVPSAAVIGVVKAPGRKLTFSKRSKDLSGKCSFYESGNTDDILYGVLYEFDSVDKEKLDRAEGKGNGYNEQLVSFELNGQTYTPFTYVAQHDYLDGSLRPYDWYKQLVVEGAKYHSMPDEYISWLERIDAIPDSDVKRNSENLARLESIREFYKRVK